MAIYFGSARSNEKKTATGGKNGDQRQKLNSSGYDMSGEVSMQIAYNHSKGWNLFRAKDPEKANLIGTEIIRGCNNAHIGYDQGANRPSLMKIIKDQKLKSLKDVKTDCATDCAQFIRAVVYIVFGVDLDTYASNKNFYTGNAKSALKATKLFEEVSFSSVSKTTLYNGDILCTKTKGHIVGVAKGNPRKVPAKESEKFMIELTVLKKGSKGKLVKTAQRLLIAAGYSCGPCKDDGDMGADTVTAVKKFQKANKLTENGTIDQATWKALLGV